MTGVENVPLAAVGSSGQPDVRSGDMSAMRRCSGGGGVLREQPLDDAELGSGEA